jgi:hypothetical protein
MPQCISRALLVASGPNSRSGKEFYIITDLTFSFFGVSPDGQLLVRYDAEGRIVIEKLDDRKILARYDPEGQDRSREQVPFLVFVSGGRKLHSSDGVTGGRLWDVPDPR